MTIEVERLKGEKKEIYSYLWGNRNLDFDLIETGIHDHSYEFSFGKRDIVSFIAEKLAKSFNIKQKDLLELFLSKFRMSCNGTGDELKKITTMHSSSLCALLFFFKVSEDSKLEIPYLDGYVFEKSFFEFKNKVIGYPSNVDVVLLGKNKDGRKIIFFIESKFSEYVTGITKKCNKYKIGKSYFDAGCYSKPIYDNICKKLDIKLEKGKDCYCLISAEDKYIEGLKQIVSHYYGIRNFLNNKFYEKDNPCLEEIKNYNADEFILGEILFDNFSEAIKTEYLDLYEKDYETLAKTINEQCKSENINNFHILEKSLRYSQLEDYIFELQKVHSYYFGK